MTNVTSSVSVGLAITIVARVLAKGRCPATRTSVYIHLKEATVTLTGLLVVSSDSPTISPRVFPTTAPQVSTTTSLPVSPTLMSFLSSASGSRGHVVENDTLLQAPTTPIMAGTDESSYELSAMVVEGLWTGIIVVGALGNGLVIYTMGRHGERSATNYYIINLAVSDFAVLTTVVPFTTAMFTSFDWRHGAAVCKITVYLIYVMLQATCLTLTAMTIDRYFAIVHPISSLRDRTPRAAVLISISTWLASLCACVPFLVYSQLQYHSEPSGLRVYCVSQWPSDTWDKVVTAAFVMSTYVLPLFIIVVCYTLILRHLWRRRVGSRREAGLGGGCAEAGMTEGPVARRRRRVAKTVFGIVLLFAVTWLPIHVFNLCYVLIHPFPKTPVTYSIKIVCHTLSYLNSCLNPFVYGFLGDGFRQAFRKSFPRCTARRQVVPAVTNDAGPSTTLQTRLVASQGTETVRSRILSPSVLPTDD